LKKIRHFLFLFAGLAMLFGGCKKSSDKVHWDTEILTPIAKANLSLNNLVGDSMVSKGSDNVLRLVYKNPLFHFDFSNYLLQIPDTGIGSKFTIDSFNLGEQAIKLKMTEGQLALALIAGGTSLGGALGHSLITNNGRTMIYPAISGLGAPPSNFDASFYFTSADILRGYLGGYVINHFPIALTNVTFELRNATSGTILVHDVIPLLNPGDAYYVQYPLDGKHIESSFTVQLISFSTPGSGVTPLPVDTSDYVMLDFKVWGLRASSATAVFPSMDVLTVTQEITQNLGSAKLTYLEASEGRLHIYISSSIPEQIQLTFTLDGAYDKAGRPLTKSTTVPGAPPGGLSHIDQILDISGYSLSLTGANHDKFNTYTQTVKAHVDSSGISRTITSADSIRISYSLENIKPRVIKGYAGNDTIHIAPTTSAFDFFNAIKAGTLDLEDVKVGLELENGIGVKGDVVIHDFEAKKNSSSVALNAPTVIDQRIHVNKATEFPFSPSTSNVTLNKSNSNIKNLIELFPNNIQYAMDVYMNPQGDDHSYSDFVNTSSRLNVNLDFEMPLSLKANNLTLQDTIPFALASSIDQLNAITDGTVHIIAENSYPMEASVTMIVYDDFFNVVDTLVKNYVVAPGDLNNVCRVTAQKRSIINISADKAHMEKLKLGTKAVIVARFSTKSNQPACNSYLKIYSDYQLSVKLTADFHYDLHAKF